MAVRDFQCSGLLMIWRSFTFVFCILRTWEELTIYPGICFMLDFTWESFLFFYWTNTFFVFFHIYIIFWLTAIEERKNQDENNSSWSLRPSRTADLVDQTKIRYNISYLQLIRFIDRNRFNWSSKWPGHDRVIEASVLLNLSWLGSYYHKISNFKVRPHKNSFSDDKNSAAGSAPLNLL